MSGSGTVTVRYGRSSQRLHHRLTAPLHVIVRGVGHTAIDWSVGGFRYRPEPPQDFVVGDATPITLCVPFHGFNVSVEVQARVVRIVKETGDVALQFIDLPARAKELLHYFSDNLLRGEMAPIEGTIKRLDLPVTPPRPEPPKPAAQGSGNERRVRNWFVGSAYLTVGVVLAGSLAYTLYKTIFLVPSEQAMVYASTVDLIGPEDGTVSAVHVRDGDAVAAGDPLVSIRSPRLERLLSEARIQEREAKITRERLISLIAHEERTLRPYGEITADQLTAARARLSAAQENVALLQRQRARMAPLLGGGYVSTQELDRVDTDLQRAQSAVLAAQAELRIADAAHTAARSGTYFTANRLEGELPQLQVDLIAATERVSLATARLKELEEEAERLQLRAPVSGRVRQVTVVAGSAVSGGAMVVSLQADERPRVYAMVPSEKLARIVIGTHATVYVPALSKDVKAEVVAIEPRIWMLPSNVRRLLGDPASAGLVILSFGPEQSDVNALHPGLPVAVEFAGEGPSRAVRWVADVLGIRKTQVTKEGVPANAEAVRTGNVAYVRHAG